MIWNIQKTKTKMSCVHAIVSVIKCEWATQFNQKEPIVGLDLKNQSIPQYSVYKRHILDSKTQRG